jgi:peptidase E
MSIILAGGGDPSQSLLLDWWFRNAIRSSTENSASDVAYIPHAIAPHTWDWERAEKWLADRDAMKDIRVQTIRDLRNEVSVIIGAKSVFLMGGNTYRLLGELQHSGILPQMASLAKSKLVYGISAGAIIMGHSIGAAALGAEADKNDIELKDLSGLDLLNGMNVFPHFRNEDIAAAKLFAQSEVRPCICVSEEGGGYWNNNKLTNIGSDAIRIVYPDGSIISLPQQGALIFSR